LEVWEGEAQRSGRRGDERKGQGEVVENQWKSTGWTNLPKKNHEIPSGNQTWQWNIHHYFVDVPIKTCIFDVNVPLPESNIHYKWKFTIWAVISTYY
jgi:hypothetical protein